MIYVIGAIIMHTNWFNQDSWKTKIKFIKISFDLRLITFGALDADIFLVLCSEIFSGILSKWIIFKMLILMASKRMSKYVFLIGSVYP